MILKLVTHVHFRIIPKPDESDESGLVIVCPIQRLSEDDLEKVREESSPSCKSHKYTESLQTRGTRSRILGVLNQRRCLEMFPPRTRDRSPVACEV